MMARRAAGSSSPAAWPSPTRSKRFDRGAAPDRWPVNRGTTSTTGTANTAYKTLVSRHPPKIVSKPPPPPRRRKRHTAPNPQQHEEAGQPPLGFWAPAGPKKLWGAATLATPPPTGDHPQARSALTAPHDAGSESRPAPAGSDADGPDGPAPHQAQSHFANPPTSKLSSKVDASGICHSRPSQRNRRSPGNRPNPRRRSNGDNQPISISAKKVTSSQRIMTPV